MNVPLGVAALPAALWLIPDLRWDDEEGRRALDGAGFVLARGGSGRAGRRPGSARAPRRSPSCSCGVCRSVPLGAYASIAFAEWGR
ncbi:MULTISPECIES: hypothetical protein [unclassified Streptomyces]|uniref:hypothetical protein n=1 Tax=unclassified Streptomyces TaxID=2593676 RepID=UPI0038246FC9